MSLLPGRVGAGRPPVDIPVEPDAETARRWAEAELADEIYHERPDLLALAFEWVLEQLAEAERGITSLDPVAAAVVVAAFVVVAGGIALLVAGPLRRSGNGPRTSVDVFGDDVRTAAELRASADALAREGAWAAAVLDRFRAILRSLEERVLLDERPGRTAHEASEEAALRLPGCADELRRAGRLFDDVCYGDAAAGPEHDAWLRAVDARVGAARPERSVDVEVPAGSLQVPR